MVEKDKTKKGAWRTVFVGSLAQFADLGEENVINTLFPVMRQSIPMDVGHLGIVRAGRNIVSPIFTPIWGMLGDRYSRKDVLIWGTGIWGIWTFLIGFSSSFQQLLILSIIAGIGLVALQSPLNSLISDLFPEKKRGRAFGIMRGLATLAGVAGILLLGQLAKMPEGWRLGYWIFGGLSVLAGVLTWLFVPEPIRGQTEDAVADASEEVAAEIEAKNPFEVKKVPRLFKILTMDVILIEYIPSTFVFNAVLGFLVIWLVDDRGFGPDSAASVFAVFALGCALGEFASGLIGDAADRRSPRYGRITLVIIARAVTIVLSILLFQTRWSNNSVYWILALIFGIFVTTRHSAAMAPMTSAILLPEVRTTGFAIIGTVFGIVSAAAALLIGQLGSRHGLTQTFFWAVTVMLVVDWLIWFAFYPLFYRDAERVQGVLTERRTTSAAEHND